MQTWCLFNHRSTSFVLLSTRSAPLSQAGRGCWISSWTIEPAARQAEGGNKAPYCPPFHLKDGTNWLYKRHQRRVLLRVPITIESLGGRSENRKVMSVITAGVQALIRPNGLVLITREALRCLKTGSVFPQGSSASSVFFLFFFLNHDCVQPATNRPTVNKFLSPLPVFLSLTLHPCGPETSISSATSYTTFSSTFHTQTLELWCEKEMKATQKI